MDKNFWSRACSSQVARTITDHRQANSGSGVFAVRPQFAHINLLYGPLALTHQPDCPVLFRGIVQRIVACALDKAAAAAHLMPAAAAGGSTVQASLVQAAERRAVDERHRR